MKDELPKQILLVLTFILCLLIGYIVFADNSFVQSDLSDKTINEYYVYAPNVPYYPVTVVLSSVVEELINCESGGRHIVDGELLVGDTDLKIQAFGIGQFQRDTFTWLAELSGREELRIENEQDQFWLLNWSIENNYGELWSCYNKVVIR